MIFDRVSKAIFRGMHGHQLIYNQCWEDPKLDHVALKLGPQDEVLVITSAGCNALDYALAGPQKVHAVDVNPRQNALLELKLAGIRQLDYETFFSLFGKGRVDRWQQLYADTLRSALPGYAQEFWDRKGWYFSSASRRGSFYYHGTSGTFAWLIRQYITRVAKSSDALASMLNSTNIEQQQSIFNDRNTSERIFRPFIKWCLRRDTTLALLGVPRSQRKQLESQYPGGIAQFVQDRVEAVFTRLPLQDNYFWRVYLTGQYTPECCPEYLKPENFAKLKAGLVDRVEVHTDTVLHFLRSTERRISRFVLLDHMDWLWEHMSDVLADEWQAIIDRATPGARILFRSAGLQVNYVDPLNVQCQGRAETLGHVLRYDHDLAAELHTRDRVHTYGSFYIADLLAA